MRPDLMRCGWLMLILVAVRAAGGNDSSPAPGTLSGRVVDPAGHGVAAARVWTAGKIRQERGLDAVVETRTDDQGRFHLGPIPAAHLYRWPLVVDAPGFARLTVLGQSVSIYPGQDHDLGAVRVDRGRVFTGQANDVDGTPRPGAVVELVVYRHNMGHTVSDIGPETTVTTDAEGRFRTPPLPVGQLALSIQAPERQLAYATRQIAPGGQEDLGTIPLTADVPFSATVQDEEGRPIEGVKIGGTVGHSATTDASGRFTLRGFEAEPRFQLNVSKPGYAMQSGPLAVTPSGVRYDGTRSTPPPPALRDLVVTLRRAGVIEGQVVDADSGEPIRLAQMLVCNFERKPDGEVVLRGCRSEFHQDRPGQFRATFPAPDEYHLTFSAVGYHDAEAFTPRVADLTTISGIMVKMRRRTDGSAPTIAGQTITGRVTRDGGPVRSGWVGLWLVHKPTNPVNAPVQRGRMVPGQPFPAAQAEIIDGTYSLPVPYQQDRWFVVVDTPGAPLTEIGPIAVALKETKSLYIATTPGGIIQGQATGVPPGWEGFSYVVAFNRTGVQAETRVEPR